jgi:NAD(P)-dependent dehydrogenase (short-subunit alcohol dehydrogenase family)
MSSRPSAPDPTDPPRAPGVPPPALDAGYVPGDLRDRCAVVTGGNGGIGFGIARALSLAGADVSIWARNEDKSAAAVSALEEAGRGAAGFRCDVRDEAQVEQAMAGTVERFGRVDIMVANSGMTTFSRLDKLSLRDFERVVATNLTGTFLCFRAACRHLLERRSPGSLVAVSSAAAFHAAPSMSHYSAAKAALLALVRTAATEMAPHRIRVNTLIPGWTEVERLNTESAGADLVNATVSSIPVGRWGTPDELGAAAVFLADPRFSYLTGTNLVVDGGYSSMAPYVAAERAARGRGRAR